IVRLYYFFFFSSRRRHTRFDCDWSSDVCSSDLGSSQEATASLLDAIARFEPIPEFNIYLGRMFVQADRFTPSGPWGMDEFFYPRSEERRVGKECRSRGSPCQ